MFIDRHYCYVTPSSLSNGLLLWPWYWSRGKEFKQQRDRKGEFTNNGGEQLISGEQLVAVLQRKIDHYIIIELANNWTVAGMSDGQVPFEGQFYPISTLPPARNIKTLMAGSTIRREGIKYVLLNDTRVLRAL